MERRIRSKAISAESVAVLVGVLPDALGAFLGRIGNLAERRTEIEWETLVPRQPKKMAYFGGAVVRTVSASCFGT